ncbi:hypothetical protein, partial [Bacillus cereus]
MAFIASNLYLNIDTGGSIVYVHSLLMVLIFYLFAIKIVLLKVRGTSIYKDSYFKIVMALTLVNLI